MLEQSLVENVLGRALQGGAEFAEVFVEDRRGSSAHLDDGKVEQLQTGRDRGAGIRAVFGDTTGFAHTSDLSEASLLAAAEAAASAARNGGGGVKEVALSPSTPTQITFAETLPHTVAKTRKVELLQRANEAARGAGAAIKQVSVNYVDTHRKIQVANSNGRFVDDEQVRTRFAVQCVAMSDGGMQTAFDAVGRTSGFEFYDELDVAAFARGQAEVALRKLNARPAPSGEVPIVMKHGAGGVLFHEACGHGLEVDLVQKDASVYKDRLGQQVASPLVTLVDDGTYSGQWGAYSIDDEGNPSKKSVLIEDGVLTDYMWDYLRARKEGYTQPGNGRRQSYQHLPICRMTNTFLMNGDAEAEDVISSTDYGVYVAQLSGGQVNTATGDFVFGIGEGYLIEHGEITDPIRDSQLTGNGPDVLKNIDVIANDFAFGWPGFCGKDGQTANVGQGMPTLRVPTGLTVGGTAA